MEFEEANDLLKPGYLPIESGYRNSSDGKRLVAALTRMPGCRAKMVDWWFGWLGDMTSTSSGIRPTMSTAAGKIGSTATTSARRISSTNISPVKDGPLYKLRIDFHDPSETFGDNAYKASGAICCLRATRPPRASDPCRAHVHLSGTPTTAARCAPASGSA